MKKWENPKLQDLRLEQTESAGPQRLNCTKCPSSYNAQPEPIVDCYKCPCCPEQFHTDKYTNPYQATVDHINSVHNGQCSS